MPITIRDAVPLDAAGIARVHVQSWRTTYPGIMPQEHLDALSVAEREQTWQGILTTADAKRTHTLVVEADSGEIIGFINGGQARRGDPDYTAEIFMLYLLQSQQGRGLGRRLMAAATRRLHDDGHSTLFLWTHICNPARGFYEALGGVAVRTTQRTIQGIIYDDVGYGWNKAAFVRLIGESQ